MLTLRAIGRHALGASRRRSRYGRLSAARSRRSAAGRWSCRSRRGRAWRRIRPARSRDRQRRRRAPGRNGARRSGTRRQVMGHRSGVTHAPNPPPCGRHDRAGRLSRVWTSNVQRAAQETPLCRFRLTVPQGRVGRTVALSSARRSRRYNPRPSDDRARIRSGVAHLATGVFQNLILSKWSIAVGGAAVVGQAVRCLCRRPGPRARRRTRRRRRPGPWADSECSIHI